MLYREIIAVCSQIHTKHTNTLYGQNVELRNVKFCGSHSNHCPLKGLRKTYALPTIVTLCKHFLTCCADETLRLPHSPRSYGCTSQNEQFYALHCSIHRQVDIKTFLTFI